MPKSARALWTAKLSGKPVARPSAEPVTGAGRSGFRGIVLGIDPSIRGMGLALVDFSLGLEAGKLLGSRTLKLPARLSQNECAGEIHRAVSAIIAKHRPDCLSLEQPIYVQNFQTSLAMGMSRGAAIGPAAEIGIPIYEYAPSSIKKAVVGHGQASKEQVAGMIRQMLRIAATLPFDESDAAAAAFCHALTYRDV